jgi:hypothetical protein
MVIAVNHRSFTELFAGVATMHIINKNAWHYKAYKFSFHPFGVKLFGDIPEKTSLCKYFWQVILGPLIAPIILILILFVGLVIAGTPWLIGNAYHIVTAQGTVHFTESGANAPFYVKRFEFQPLHVGNYSFSVSGAVQLVWVIAILTAVGFGLTYLVGADDMIAMALEVLMWGGGIIAVITFFVLTVAGISKARRSESLKLTKAYIKARKDKVCPIVSFED